MKSGDHIYIYIRHKGYKFTHHGIYIGDNRVIHYWNDKIRRSKLYKKSKKWYGKTIHVKKHKYSYSSERVIKRAEKRLSEKKYALAFNNCEHFAYWCKTGKHRSKQVEEAPLKAFKYATKKFQYEIKKTRNKAKAILRPFTRLFR
jgi:Lecithin retinol acyltransferase